MALYPMMTRPDALMTAASNARTGFEASRRMLLPMSGTPHERQSTGYSMPLPTSGQEQPPAPMVNRTPSVRAPNLMPTTGSPRMTAPMTPSMINARRAAAAADFAESAPAPMTQEAYQRRRTHINDKRREASMLHPGMFSYTEAPALSPTPTLRDKAYAFNAVARGTQDPNLAAELSGLGSGEQPTTPATGTPYESPAPPANLPRERDVAQDQAAADKSRKKRFPLTAQHAKSMYDAILSSGADIEGFNPQPIFRRLMREYGLNYQQADSMAQSFTQLAQNPDAGMKYLQPDKQKQIRASADPLAAAEAANPFTPGNVMPGHNLVGNASEGERRAGPDGIERVRRSDGFWHPVSME